MITDTTFLGGIPFQVWKSLNPKQVIPQFKTDQIMNDVAWKLGKNIFDLETPEPRPKPKIILLKCNKYLKF